MTYERSLFRCGVVALGMLLLAGTAQAHKNYWLYPYSDTWSNAAAWSRGVPGNGGSAHVRIVADGDYTISVDGDYRVRKLRVDSPAATVDLLGGSVLTVAKKTFVFAGTLLFDGGTLKGGKLRSEPLGQIVFTSNGGTMYGVRIRTNLTLNNPGAALTLAGNCNLKGNILLSSDYSTLNLDQNFALKRGTIAMTGANSRINIADGDYLLLRKRGVISGQGTIYGDVINKKGLTLASVDGATLAITGSSFINLRKGRMQADANCTLEIDSTNWANYGWLIINGGNFGIGGSTTTAGLGLGRWIRTGGDVYVAGTLDNSGATLNLAQSGSISLRGGTILNGQVVQDAVNQLLFTSSGGTLNGATLVGDMNLSSDSAYVQFANGGGFTGNATLAGAGAHVDFVGPGSLSMSAGISMTGSNCAVNVTGGAMLTVEAGATIAGQGAIGGDSSGDVENYGTISATISGGQLVINPGTFNNNSGGLVEVSDGAQLQISAATWTNQPGGTITIRDPGSQLVLGGNWSNSGTLNIADGNVYLGGTTTSAGLGLSGWNRTGGTVHLTGMIDNTGGNLNLSQAGPIILQGGTIRNGQVTPDAANQLIFTSSGGTLNGATYHGDVNLTTDSAYVQFSDGGGFTGNAVLSGDNTHIDFMSNTTLSAPTAIDMTGANCAVNVSGGAVLTLSNGTSITGRGTIGGTAQTEVEFQTSQGTFNVLLYDAQTPLTVANFLQYVTSGRYDGTIISRSVPGFVIQGGGYTSDGQAIATLSPVANEPGISNVYGTIAMAKLPGDPDSATSQWFINLADNSANLDFQNGGFTVFGVVIGTGMDVVNQIAGLSVVDDSALDPALTDVPIDGSGNPVTVTASVVSTPGQINNAGTISATISGGQLVINPGTFNNNSGGLVEVSDGARLQISAATWTNQAGGTITIQDPGSQLVLGGNWSNSGTLNIADGNVYLGGTMTTAGLGISGWNRTGGTVYLTGTLDNTGKNLVLAQTGTIYMDGGTILNGEVSPDAINQLLFTANGGTLVGVVMNVNTDLNTDSAFIQITNGGGLKGSVTMSADNSHVDFVGPGSLSMSAGISMTGSNCAVNVTGGAMLTVEAGATIAGQGAIGGDSSGDVENYGTISATISGGQLVINPGTFNNNSGGLVEVSDGARLQISAATWTNQAGASIHVAGSGSLTSGADVTNMGTVTIDSGSVLTVGSGGMGDYLQDLAGARTVVNGTLEAALHLQHGQLAGSGSIVGDVAVTGDGWIAPGNGDIGTVTINGSLTLNAAGTLEYDFSDAASDAIQVNGDLTLTGTLDLNELSLISGGAHTYTLFTYTGSLTDSGLTVGLLPEHWLSATLDTSTFGQVDLHVVHNPEPTTLALIAVGSVILLRSGRRRKARIGAGVP